MFFYDHAMARDDHYEQESKPAGELDMLDGLRAMSMFKRDPGPLGPLDVNQEVKHALACSPQCIIDLSSEGFLSESLVRELEQMVKNKISESAMNHNRGPAGMVSVFAGASLDGSPMNLEIGNPKKKTKSRVNEAGNYTKPGLRKSIFKRIMAGNKGGKSGQWSARKAQMLAKQYKAAGGGYRD
jgi:hypothetical protein